MSDIRCVPLVLNFGGGVDSTAMLLRLVDLGVRPDYIMFADTGDEKPETYEHVHAMAVRLKDLGFTPLTIVRRNKSRPSSTGPGYSTLEGNCLQNKTLPSLAYGRKACSLKWKVDPMDSFLKKEPRIQETWAAGYKPIKLIGYDCGKADSRRSHKAEDDSYLYWHPLREWGWNREDCEAYIESWDIDVPVKSACWYCPSSKPHEVKDLAHRHPELFRRAIAMEDNARPYFQTIRGLGRNWSWREFAEKEGLISRDGRPIMTLTIPDRHGRREEVDSLEKAMSMCGAVDYTHIMYPGPLGITDRARILIDDQGCQKGVLFYNSDEV